MLAYIPETLGGSKDEANSKKEKTSPINPGQPPNRPDHDVQVEQFLRDQYHSKAGDGMPDLGEK